MSNKIYVVGAADDDDFAPVARMLRARDWDVRNTPADLEKDLRHQLGVFLECRAICLLETWWTTTEGYWLQLLAGATSTTHVEAFSGEELKKRA